ncbi:Alkaline phosphatase [hydrothermal vent metagenome]|uniref:Alkaline phosphatase n=1 Tax=hydrothermal vent metagenome TaxID=652676 RepID=A0A3B1CFW8_9ZZZZ
MRSFILALSLLFMTSTIISQNVTLRDNSNQYDFVIITIDQFVPACETFKDHKENTRNLKTLVTTKNQILSEFNDSVLVQDNIREFISYAGTNWASPKPIYFMFAADVDSIPNFSFESIPGYEPPDTSRSDYFYGINIFDEDTTKLSFAIGRISARTETELTNYFSKVITYESDPQVYPWNNNALYIADDGKSSNGDDGHLWERIAIDVSNETPDFINHKYFFESDTSEYFGTTDSIINYVNNIGTSAIIFSGHANDVIFTHEGFFTISDIAKLDNLNKPFFASIAYNTFSGDGHTSMTDQMLFSKSGALAGIASVGLTYTATYKKINRSIWKNLYTEISIGENFLISDLETTRRENTKYNIFGDPTLVLKFDLLASTKPINKDMPSDYMLSQNYPNPFNPSTKIKYSIPNVEMGHAPSVRNVTLKVYDILGREVATLVNEQQSPGNYEAIFNASHLPSGSYFYQLRAGTFVQTKKMLLIK